MPLYECKQTIVEATRGANLTAVTTTKGKRHIPNKLFDLLYSKTVGPNGEDPKQTPAGQTEEK